MPHYQQGDMWSVWESADLFVITTNSTLRADGALVMGRGIAGRRATAFPRHRCCSGPGYRSDIRQRWRLRPAGQPIMADRQTGCLQVKRDWRDTAALDLIRRSTALLVTWCSAHPDSQVHLNLPGIGNGRLSRDVVIPIISALPETVTIWEMPAPVPASAAIATPDAPLLQPPHPVLPSGTVLEDWDQEAQREGSAGSWPMLCRYLSLRPKGTPTSSPSVSRAAAPGVQSAGKDAAQRGQQRHALAG